MAYKMALVVRTDLDMRKGKIAAQCSHAAVGLVTSQLNPTSQYNRKVWDWLNGTPSQTKVVLRLEGDNQLDKIDELADLCELEGVQYTIIQDAGRTQVEPGSVTVIGIGPDEDSKIDKITGDLKLL
jgi:PTH2 family peptidyl-tRNA hydrolase